MTNRLAELEAYLAMGHPPTRKEAHASAPGVRPRSHAAPSRSRAARRRARAANVAAARAFTVPVDYRVPGTVPALAQRGSDTCWATVATMLLSWKQNRSLDVGQALDAIGGSWRAKYDADQSLLGAEKATFLAAAGLIAEPPMNPSVDGWTSMLRRYGPLWVTTDEASGDDRWAIHARVLRGIHGDGTPQGTTVDVVDPDGGREYSELLARLQTKFEEEAQVRAKSAAPLRLQIVHWPLETGIVVQQSLRSAQLAGPAVVPLVGLGIAVFNTGRTLATQGSLSYSAQEASHVFPNTPPDTQRTRSTMDMRICAHHPRYGIDTQHFYFRLEVEHNGHDILLSRINLLRDRSSSLHMSTFHADLRPQADPPVNNRATIRYLIDGQWDPVGRGDVSFRGELHIGPDGTAAVDIESEQGWVYVEPNPWSNVQRVKIPTPKKQTEFHELFFDPPGSDKIVAGTERGLLDWYDRLPQQLRHNVQTGVTTVTIHGHASTTSTDDKNRELARRRAQRVEAILRDHLGPNARLEIRAVGERASGPDGLEDRAWRKVRVEIVHYK